MPLTVSSLRGAIGGIADRLETDHGLLTSLDAQVGDGDLGITLLKAFRELKALSPNLADDLGQALLACAGAVAKVSSSSFGTLLATALISASKSTKGVAALPWTEIPSLLDGAIAAMSARGKATLGDKTVLDALAAASKAGAEQAEPGPMLDAMIAAVDGALDGFRSQTSKVGRARIFGERTIGLDDPGMVAFRVMLGSLPRASAAS
jgi:phosphoenolpyruvate---glycerone phosphotransferase subunit DhaL